MEKKSQLEIKVDNLKALEASLKTNRQALVDEIAGLNSLKESRLAEIETAEESLKQVNEAHRAIVKEGEDIKRHRAEELEKISQAYKSLETERDNFNKEKTAWLSDELERTRKIESLNNEINNLSTRVESLKEIEKELLVKVSVVMELSDKITELESAIESDKTMIQSQKRYQDEILATFDKDKNLILKEIDEAREELSRIQKSKESVKELEIYRTMELDKREDSINIRAARLKRAYKEKFGIDINV